ncbi:hypothetical protein HanOQP8_Chr16g0630861 [Helianthus annuus]|nr:hypothetical protein HanHA89_Chr16g0676101 [Helianthus annuus]KAJ0646049.1 hypothetical protein HanOQP8_Chr16g0630861 [Helianthus annuus]
MYWAGFSVQSLVVCACYCLVVKYRNLAHGVHGLTSGLAIYITLRPVHLLIVCGLEAIPF